MVHRQVITSQRLGPNWDHTSRLPANPAHVAHLRKRAIDPVDQAKPILPRPGGRGVAGSNPVVPTALWVVIPGQGLDSLR
jgi:hypothetical protein